jgi:outer membrane protein assembly factor BamB
MRIRSRDAASGIAGGKSVPMSDKRGRSEREQATRRSTRRADARGLLIAASMFACGLIGPAMLAPSRASAQSSATYPDDSVSAKEGLPRIRELAEAGSLTEAARVAQQLLDSEGDKVVEVVGAIGAPAIGKALEKPGVVTEDRFLPVRREVHELLLSLPKLLERYRSIEGPRADRVMESGDWHEVERTRLMTRAGLTAALRLAQNELEAARFESARLSLTQLEKHPDRKSDGEGSRDAARLAAMLARYLPRESVKELAKRWAADAAALGQTVSLDGAPIPTPRGVLMGSASPADSGSPIDEKTIPPKAVQAVALGDEDLDSEIEMTGTGSPYEDDGPLVFPVVSGDALYVNDGINVSALDRDTLSLLWQLRPQQVGAGTPDPSDLINGRPGYSRKFEDVTTCAVGGGVVVAPMGLAVNGQRSGDSRIHGIDARTGRVLWSVSLSRLDPGLGFASVRGPAVIDGDTVVLTLRRPVRGTVTMSLHLLGLDLYTGQQRWMRTVASVGRLPWIQVQRRADASILHEGVVYRADEMGVVIAYEAASGRPVWVRRIGANRETDFNRRTITDQAPPFALSRPIIDGRTLIVHEPGQGSLLRIDMETGEAIAGQRRDASAFGEVAYFTRVGDYLAGVGKSHVSFVRASEFAEGTSTLHMMRAREDAKFTGRASAAGSRLVVPVADGVLIVDPADPTNPIKAPLEGSGNLLAAGGHLLSADFTRLRSYITWEEARTLLEARIKVNPANVAAMLTFVELAHRAGKTSEAPDFADRALTALDAVRGETLQPERRRLFELLLGIVHSSRMAPAPGVQAVPTATVDRLVRSMERAAELPEERLAYLLELAAHREAKADVRGAVEAYQEVLADASLCAARRVIPILTGAESTAAPIAPSTPPDRSGMDRRARDRARTTQVSKAGGAPEPMPEIGEIEATRRLFEMVVKSGIAVYAAFDDEASRAATELGANAPVDRVRATARRYPLAGVTPGLWARAAADLDKAGKPGESLRALGLGLRAAEMLIKAGAPDRMAEAAALGGDLVKALATNGRAPGAYRLLRRLSAELPGLELKSGGEVLSTTAMLDELRRTVAQGSGLARLLPTSGRAGSGASVQLGMGVASDIQVLPGWMPVESASGSSAGSPSDCILMSSGLEGKVALFVVPPETGALTALWSRPFDRQEPVAIASGLDDTLLFWPSSRGGTIECIENATGKTRWTSPEFSALFPPTDARRAGEDRFSTPVGGEVRYTDLIVSEDESIVALVERGGRAAAFGVADGQPLWHAILPVPRVFDVAGCGGVIAVAGCDEQTPDNGAGVVGAGPRGGDSPPEPRLISIDKRTGAVVARVGGEPGKETATSPSTILGEHVRWLRSAGQGRLVAGVHDGLVFFDAATARVLWSARQGMIKNPAFGSILGDKVFVLDAERNLYMASLTDGRLLDRPLDTRHRVEFPVSIFPSGERLVLSGRPGVLIYSTSGELVGTDLPDEDGWLVAPVAGHGVLVGLNAAPGGGDYYNDRPRRGSDQPPMEMCFLSSHNGSMIAQERIVLHDEPKSLALIDGKVILTVGSVTLVMDVVGE